MPPKRITRRTPFMFERLPLDTQCEILGYEISLEDLFTLRTTDKHLYNLSTKCVKHLDSPEDKEIPLPVDLALSLEKIKTISPNYPIVLTSLDQVNIFAKHETLRQAAFDLSNLVKNNEEFINVIGAFWVEYPTRGNDCKYCADSPTYDFTFVYGDPINAIRIYEGGIVIVSNITAGDVPTLTGLTQQDIRNVNGEIKRYILALIKFIITKVPICDYKGPLMRGLSILPCLQSISIDWKIGDLDLNPIIPLLHKNIKEVYVHQPGEQSQVIPRMVMDRLIVHLMPQKFPNITKFGPIPAGSIEYVRGVFPNLQELRISMGSIITNLILWKEQWPYLNTFDSIVLEDDVYHGQENPEYLIKKHFPKAIRDRVTVISS